MKEKLVDFETAKIAKEKGLQEALILILKLIYEI